MLLGGPLGTVLGMPKGDLDELAEALSEGSKSTDTISTYRSYRT